ncbi:MAG: SDR family oxidoreductase [Rhodobacteraceae bacterium]|nr:MAG: SDR family oxidoreductase [Paracoccaceae bacterium]
MRQKRYFVTGAASGLGLELLRELAARGHHVIATGRRTAAALPADFPDLPYLSCDLAQPDQARAAGEWARGQGSLDAAILNAAAGFYRPLHVETAAEMAAVLRLNLDANMILAQMLCPVLQGGRLGLIGSVAHRGAPGMPVYAASKGALDGFGRALAEEWRGKVTVRVLHPGPVATGMSERAGRARNALDRLFLPPRAMALALIAALEARNGADRQVIAHRRVAQVALQARLGLGGRR